MNSPNHFLGAFTLLFIVFHEHAALWELIIFSLVFGVLVDLGQIIGRRLKKPVHHRRIWLEEPFGVILIGIPVGLVLGLFNQIYFGMTVLAYASHIVLDYLAYHEVSPFAPFSKKTMMTGFILASQPARWYTGKERGIPENYFTFFALAALFVVLFLA